MFYAYSAPFSNFDVGVHDVDNFLTINYVTYEVRSLVESPARFLGLKISFSDQV